MGTVTPRSDGTRELGEIINFSSVIKDVKLSYVSGYKTALYSLCLKETFSLSSAMLLGTCNGTQMPTV